MRSRHGHRGAHRGVGKTESRCSAAMQGLEHPASRELSPTHRQSPSIPGSPARLSIGGPAATELGLAVFRKDN